MQFDWISDVIAPAASIIVPTAVAIVLANRTLGAARRDRQIASLADFVRSLSRVSESWFLGDTPESRTEFSKMLDQSNVTTTFMRGKDRDVVLFVVTVCFIARDKGPRNLSHTASWCVDLIHAWIRGEQPTSAFTDSLPDDADMFTSDTPPAEYPQVVLVDRPLKKEGRE